MIITKYVRSETASLADILERLQGQVFHVTKLAYLPSIRADGEIRPNTDGALQTTLGSSTNAFFRNRGCVSLFDYRSAPSPEIEDFRYRCYPFQPAAPDKGGIAIFLVKPEALEVLIPWTRWREEGALRETVVPHVEAGYPGPLQLAMVSEIITLELTGDPDSFMATFRRA